MSFAPGLALSKLRKKNRQPDLGVEKKKRVDSKISNICHFEIWFNFGFVRYLALIIKLKTSIIVINKESLP